MSEPKFQIRLIVESTFSEAYRIRRQLEKATDKHDVIAFAYAVHDLNPGPETEFLWPSPDQQPLLTETSETIWTDPFNTHMRLLKEFRSNMDIADHVRVLAEFYPEASLEYAWRDVNPTESSCGSWVEHKFAHGQELLTLAL
jgi:hypothetical protein